MSGELLAVLLLLPPVTVMDAHFPGLQRHEGAIHAHRRGVLTRLLNHLPELV